jgi:hypothetical protein
MRITATRRSALPFAAIELTSACAPCPRLWLDPRSRAPRSSPELSTRAMRGGALLWTRRRPADICNTYDVRARAAGRRPSRRARRGDASSPLLALLARASPCDETRRAASRRAIAPEGAPRSGPIRSSEGSSTFVERGPSSSRIAHLPVARSPVPGTESPGRSRPRPELDEGSLQRRAPSRPSLQPAPAKDRAANTKTEVRSAAEHQERAPSFLRARPGGAPVHATRSNRLNERREPLRPGTPAPFFTAPRCPA